MAASGSSPADGQRSQSLARDSIGIAPVLFQSVTLMGPAVALVYSMQPSLPYSGIALPLSVLMALLLVLCTASSIGQLGKLYADAGGTYSYIARALGARTGFVVGWFNLFFQPFFAVLLLLIMTNIVQSTLETKAHVHVASTLIILITAGVIYAMTVLGVRLSTKAGVVLGALEVSIFVALSLWLIIDAGSANTAHAFSPSHSATGDWTGIWKGAVFGVLAFVGFEGAAVLGEESRDPKRLIPRAVVLAAVAVGVFYVLGSYGAVVGWHGSLTAYASDSNPWQTMATRVWGAGWVLAFFAILNSAQANANAGVNSAGRVFFSMGRAGALPALFGRTHPRYQTPHIAIAFNVAVGIVIALIAEAKWGTLTGFAVTATAFVVLVIFTYIMANVACAVAYAKRRTLWNPFLHLVLPLAGVVAMGFALYYTYVPLSPAPVRYALYFAPIWAAVGIVVMFVLSRTHPQVVEATNAALGEETLVPERLEHPDLVAGAHE
jgi:amino acid transporter